MVKNLSIGYDYGKWAKSIMILKDYKNNNNNKLIKNKLINNDNDRLLLK